VALVVLVSRSRRIIDVWSCKCGSVSNSDQSRDCQGADLPDRRAFTLSVIFLEQPIHGLLHEDVSILVIPLLDSLPNEPFNFRSQSNIHKMSFARQTLH